MRLVSRAGRQAVNPPQRTAADSLGGVGIGDVVDFDPVGSLDACNHVHTRRWWLAAISFSLKR